MLTRLEVDGFKNLLGLAVDFGPFTCIAGPNASGKSNVFDAIAFLSRLADHSLLEVSDLVRTTTGRGGDPRQLFWTDGARRTEKMSLAVEMIVPPTVEDDFGRTASPTTTYLRYELELGYEEPTGLDTLGRLVLRKEALHPLGAEEARQRLKFPHSASNFHQWVIGSSSTERHPFIWTEAASDGETHVQPMILVSQDQHRGRPSPSPATNAKATVVSTITTTEHPTILAARREMQSWRQLALEPSAMRSPSDFREKRQIATNGSHVATTLYHLATRRDGASPPDPTKTYDRLATRISELIPVEEIRIDRDDKRELLTLELREKSTGFLPARALSDGTLRFIALAVIGLDTSFNGLICMEEPENGIHPARLEAMVELVRSLAVDPSDEVGDDNPFRQVIVNTHSPGFVRLVYRRAPDELLLAKQASVRNPDGEVTHTLRLRPIRGTWRCVGDGERGVDLIELLDYLEEPPEQVDSQPELVDAATAPLETFDPPRRFAYPFMDEA
jgi:predicted ATPase